MTRKKKPAGKTNKKAAKPSFLKRLLNRDPDEKKSRKGGDSGKAPEKKKPLTPLEKSIAEIRQLQKVGERDPERLATLLANILSKEKQKQDQAKEKFDSMVWDIVNRDENSSPGDGDKNGDAKTGEPGTEGKDSPPDPLANPN